MQFDIKTSLGSLRLELNTEKAPNTTANFAKYAEAGYYDGTIFHRVIPNFMIQGGGFTPGMEEKLTEAPINNEANNELKNDFGTIAMARTGDPHSATSQFFINMTDNAFLDFTAETNQGWGYCVFGNITDGEEVLREIAKVDTGTASGHSDVPVEDVVIESITIVAEETEETEETGDSSK